MRVFLRRIAWIALLLSVCIADAAAKDLAVVSNKSNSLQAIALADLVRVCKGQTNRWPDGKPVTLVILDPASGEMRLLLQKVYESSPDAVRELMSTANHGRTNHPAIVVVDSDESLVQKVESIPGAVGVVDVYSITSGVTVLKVAGKSPFEVGYLLHGN
ncbi:MAG: hypothetical protein DMG68_02870 [Acidobacteria bacterium]|nr:MAG: hypothetical protein DMG68_02870 [Acidobacteriota bacterium]